MWKCYSQNNLEREQIWRIYTILDFQIYQKATVIKKVLYRLKIDGTDSVQFSCSVVSDTLEHHELPHARLPCPSLCPRVCSDSDVHWVSDAIQPSHPLQPSFSLAFNLSQHEGLFQSVSSSYQVAKVLELQLQQQSFQWLFRVRFLQD